MYGFEDIFPVCAYQLPRNNTIYPFFITSPNFASGRPPSERITSHTEITFVTSLKSKNHKSGTHITQLLQVRLPPKVHHIPKDLLIEHLQVSRCIAKQDLLHFVCSFLHAGKLKRSHLSLHCCKYVLDRTEFGSMGRRIYHIYGLVLHNSHNE